MTYGINASKAGQPDNTKQVLSTQSNEPQEKVVQQKDVTPGIPQRIKIPSIDVDATVESVGMDEKGRMDVPKDADNTAWFQLGFRPGQVGNAVIDGHYDKEDGSPAAFWDIPKLKTGDTIIVSDDKGNERTFSVTKIAKYPYDKFPLKEVFGESDTAKLNLITCQGEWNEKTKNYAERMVVYSELVE